ncbi:hypothetical protein F4054_13445 [Candidatus Poribacteria bacterium]|nr:hypothetical protein [Candidatus Poribacteria bacterium]MYG07901.1 hypothetical protein [Candidatus Poribacteria bacterium]MYK23249.1 hypothetical protein [Candidatus Poribacteria bacterium]
MRYLIFTLMLMLFLFSSNGYAQEYTTWGLPNGAKTRLGKGKITTIEFSPDGSHIAVASSIGIWLYDTRTGKELVLLPGHRGGFSTSVFSGVGGTLTINTLAFSPDGKLLASASEDGTLRLLDLTTYRERHTLLENKEAFVNPLEGIPVIALAFSADGKTLTSLEGTGEHRIKIWDVNSGRLLSDISERILNRAKDPAKRDRPLKPFSLSSDGKTCAATKLGVSVFNGVSDAVVRLGDVSTGNLHPTFMSAQSVQSPIQGLVFSPDGTLLAGVETKWSVAQNPDNTGNHIKTTRSKIRLWDVNTGNELSMVIPQQVKESDRYTFRERRPLVAFSPDSKMFATANQITAAVQLWEVNTGNLISTFTIPQPELAPPDRRGAIDITFSPDGNTLAIATAHSSLQFWDVRTSKIISTLAEHPQLTTLPVNDNAFISLSTSGVQLRDINTGKRLRDLTKTWTNLIKYIQEIGEVKAFAISPDSTIVVIGSEDGSLQLWNMHTEKPLSTLTGHTGSINALAFTANGINLASSSRDRSIRLWDVRTGTQLLTLTAHINSGKELEYDSNGTMLPSAEFVNNLVFSPDGRILASASELGTIWSWELNTGNLMTTLIEHEAGVDKLSVGWDYKIGLAFSANSTLLASGGMDGQVMISEVDTNPSPSIFKERHAWRVKVLVFSPDGKHLVSGSRDNSIRLWDAQTGTAFAILSGHVGEVNTLAFSADGLTLISGSIDGTILLWDWEQIAQQTNR